MHTMITKAGVGLGAAVLVAGLAGATAPVVASGASKVHTVRFNANELASHRLGKVTFAGSDVERHKGKVIGYDSFTGRYNLRTQVATIRVGVAWKGGLLFVKGTQGADGIFTGRITGGSGRYKGASGTVHGHQVDRDTTHLVARYTLP